MFKYILKKEFLLVFRNLHAMGVLFIMPMAFILIMSLALKDTYANKLDKKLEVLIQVNAKNEQMTALKEILNKNDFFNVSFSEEKRGVKTLLYDKSYNFIFTFPKDVFTNIAHKKPLEIDMFTKPDVDQQRLSLMKNLLQQALSSIYMKGILQDKMIDLTDSIHSQYVYKNKDFHIQPTSVQQSVPAWLVFSMFFILIPISNTFIQEKNLGTLNRIKSINISLFPLIFGKIVPYYIINQIQVVLMILVGMYIVPKLGGDSLVIEGNIPLIFLISSVISFAAISFAILISNISKSTEEATSIGGLSNIILAALGGVMVPKVVMPLFMQDATNYSPMAWGLESFLEVFVLGGSLNDILPNLIKLIVLGIVLLFISYMLLKRKNS